MAVTLPKGFDFRLTSGFVTDPSDCVAEIATTADYSGGQGYGWEQALGANTRDRSLTVDPRLAGIAFVASTAATTTNFRVDLPAAGQYVIVLAVGDQTTGQTHIDAELFDGAVSLGAVVVDRTTTAGQFFDAAGNLQGTAATWVTSNVAVTKTFTTTILRVALSGHSRASGVSPLAHLHIAPVPSPAPGAVLPRSQGPAAARTAGHPFAAWFPPPIVPLPPSAPVQTTGSTGELASAIAGNLILGGGVLPVTTTGAPNTAVYLPRSLGPEAVGPTFFAALYVPPAPVPNASAVIARSSTDTSLTSTACSRVLVLPRFTAGDTSVSADVATPVTRQSRAATDASLSSDVATRAQALPRAPRDTSLSTTTATRVLALPRATADTSLTAETTTPAKGYARAAADTSLSTDALTRGALIMGRSTADTSTSADAVARALALPRATADTSASSDAATGRRGTGRTLADSSTTGDAVTRSAQPFTRATADATTSTDAASRTLGLPRGGVDSSTSADTVTRLLRFPRATTDSSLTGDTATRAASASRTAGETSNTTDSATRSTRVTVTLADVSLTFDSATGPQIHPPFVSYPTSAQVTRGAPGRGNTSALVQRGPVDRSTTSSRYNN